MRDVAEELKDKANVVVLCGDEDYKEVLEGALQGIAAKYGNICLIELNKPHKTVEKEFAERQIDAKKFHFIDCVTKTSDPMAQGSENAVLLPGQTSLSMITYELSKLINGKGVEVTVLDSISTLLIYNEEVQVMKFLNTLMTGVRTSDTKAAYFMLKSDMDKSLLKDLELFADSIMGPEKKAGRKPKGTQ